MQVMTHLSFDGQCEAAFRVYERCLGGTITLLLRHGQTPGEVAPEMREQIAHATLRAGDAVLTGADVAAAAYVRPQGFAVQLNLDDAEAAQRIFDVLAEEGVVLLPMGRTFWAERYGMLTDRFGTPWEINCSATP